MKKLVLASASPRRRELLGQIGLEFEVRPSDAEELITKTKPSDIVMELASTKADAIWQQLTDADKTESIVLGADTIVVWGDEILGKPKDDEDAYRIIDMLQGKVHQVYTGVCLYYRDETGVEQCHPFYESTDVHVAPMTKAEIETYLQQGEHRDKAGAYGIQGFFERYIEGIRGDYANVVGLPIGRVYRELRDLGLMEA